MFEIVQFLLTALSRVRFTEKTVSGGFLNFYFSQLCCTGYMFGQEALWDKVDFASE